MKNISENTIKLFKSNYKLAISELENKILEKEMELENFFNNDNISKSKNSYTVSFFILIMIRIYLRDIMN